MANDKVVLSPEVWQRVLNWRAFRHTFSLLKQIFKRDFGIGHLAAIGIKREELEQLRGPIEDSSHILRFCELISRSESGQKRCKNEEVQALARMTATGKPNITICHAGLTEMAVPIIVRDKYCGCVTTTDGGLLLNPPNETEFNQITERVKDMGVNLSELKKAYFEIKPISQELVAVMIQILGSLVEEIIKAAAEIEEDKKRIVELESVLYGGYNFDKIIGKSTVMQNVFKLVSRVIEIDSPVLIEGETGTGKELIAAAIHYNSSRKVKAFMAINCGGMTETLLESELFGHIKGSFTGAIRDKKGLFEVSDQGTIFLDEIAEMSPALQVKLLRVLQEGTFIPVGGTEPRKIDVRIISATNKNLKELIAQGGFREDLYYRVNVIKITLPPLRDRPGDISLLVDHFLKTLPSAQEKKIQGIRPEAKRVLLNYAWPGNIRELQNVLERAISLASSRYITLEDLSEEIIQKKTKGKDNINLTKGLEKATEEFQKEYLAKLLSETEGDVTKAIRKSETTRASFYRLLKKYNIKPHNFNSVPS